MTDDYEPVNVMVTFVPDGSSNHLQCQNISITNDLLVENTERFFVMLNSSDSSVEFSSTLATVDIIDNSSESNLGQMGQLLL